MEPRRHRDGTVERFPTFHTYFAYFLRHPGSRGLGAQGSPGTTLEWEKEA